MMKEIEKLIKLVKQQQIELTNNKIKLRKMRTDFRVDKIYNIILLLKKEIKSNEKFRISNFVNQHKQDSCIISAFNKIGLYEQIDSCKIPKYKWIAGKVTKDDAKFIVEFLNQKAKERRILA